MEEGTYRWKRAAESKLAHRWKRAHTDGRELMEESSSIKRAHGREFFHLYGRELMVSGVRNCPISPR
jgi:hypothetical protein